MQGLIEYPGLLNVNRGTVSIGHGITPASFSLTITPQRSLPPETGAITLTYGRQKIVFPDCKIDQVSFSTDGAQLLTVSILDRRWKWAFGSISGHYNIRNPDGTVRGHLNLNDRRAVINSERTPRELAALCLEAMGERRFDVGDLPNDTRPMVEWEGENPASMLADLCEALGCRIVLRLDNTVVIRQLNTGGKLPNEGPIHRRDSTLDPAEMPDALHCFCGPNLYQSDLRLEAVGEEADGSIVPIGDLSYEPDGGWSLADVPEFNSIADQTLRNLAKRSVFRYFRPREPSLVVGYGQVEKRDQLLPLNDFLVDSVEVNGVREAKPAFVFGVWTAEGGDSGNQAATLQPVANDQDKTVLRDYQIDAERGLIITGDYIYKLVGEVPNITIGEPDLIFRTACTVRDPETMAYVRYERVRDNRGRRFGTGPRLIKHEDIRLTARADWKAADDGSYEPGPITTNIKEVNQEADHYLDEESKAYDTTSAETLVYSGLWPIELDGTIQRVSYNVGAPFASTTVERGRDPGTRQALPYKLARALEKMKSAQEVQKKLQPRQLRERAKRAGGK